MDSRIKRAKMMDQFMTIVFYGIALFFFLLLVGFAGKVIIGGLLGAKPEMFGFTRSGSIVNQVFNTIYLVFISLSIHYMNIISHLEAEIQNFRSISLLRQLLYISSATPALPRSGKEQSLRILLHDNHSAVSCLPVS